MNNISGKRYIDFLTHLKRVLLLFILFASGIFCSSLIAEDIGIATEQKPFPEDMVTDPVNLKAVKIDGGWGYTDLKGNTIISPYFQQARDFTEGLGQIRISGEWGYIDNTGKIAILPIYKETRAFSEGLAPVCIDGKWGFIDSKGDKKIDFKYADAHRINEGVAAVSETCQPKTYGYISTDGTYAIKPQFDDAGSFTEGLAAVRSNGKWGYINHEGIMIIPCTFEKAEHFSKGLAAVMLDYKWGYISPDGKFIVNPEYDIAGNFTDDGAMVSKDSKSHIIDRNGENINTLDNLDGDTIDINNAWSGTYYSTSITIVNFTDLTIIPVASERLNNPSNIKITPFCSINYQLSNKHIMNLNDTELFIFTEDRQKTLCSLYIYNKLINRYDWWLCTYLINQWEPRKGVSCHDKRPFRISSVSSNDGVLIFQIDHYVWVLVKDIFQTPGYKLLQPTLFLFDTNKFPDWEYIAGIK